MGKNEKMHRKMSLAMYGTIRFAGKLKQRWESLTHRQKGKARKQIEAAIATWKENQTAQAISESVAQPAERKF